MAEERTKKSYDRKVLKIFAPVLPAADTCSGLYVYMSAHPLEIQRDGTSAVYGFWLINNVFFPALTVVLLLVQWLIILPWWDRVITNISRAKGKAAGVLFGICIILAVLLGLFEWRPAFGGERLVISIVFLFFIELIYWLPNIVVLYLVDRSRIAKPKPRRR